MKKLYYCCIECHEIFGCVQNRTGNFVPHQIKCSACRKPCQWDGATEESFKPEQLSHGLCKKCYYRREVKDAKADWEDWVLKGGK